MKEQPPDGITVEDWGATPSAVRVLVRALREQVTLLEQRVGVLEEQGRQTSRTSSKPPSSDPPSVPPRPPRRPSGRPTGAQPGHAGHGRLPVSADRVDRVVDVKPDACAPVLCGPGGRRSRPGAPSGGRPAARTGGRHRLSAAYAALWSVWRAHNGDVAGGDAARELRAAGAGDGGVSDGAAGREPA
jgi:hypothetical protein